MKSNTLTNLLQEFTTERLTSDSAIWDKYLATFPFKQLRAELRWVHVTFQRKWIITSLRGHLNTCRLIRSGLKNSPTINPQQFEQAWLWLAQAHQLEDTVHTFSNYSSGDLSNLELPLVQLKPGDVVLSYKTKEYLRSQPLSWQVRLASNSPVTHALVVASNHDGEIKLMAAGDATSGLGIVTAEPKPGEIFLIMSPTPEIRERLLPHIASWQVAAEAHSVPWPELKVQIANVIGIFTVLMAFLEQPLVIKNPYNKQKGVYCSELIDRLFKEIGIVISPRCVHDSLISPIELFYSPYLIFQGVIVNPVDRNHLKYELRDQFLVN